MSNDNEVVRYSVMEAEYEPTPNEGVVINLPGGVTRVTVGPGSKDNTPEAPGVEQGRGVIDGSTMRVSTDGSMESFGGVTRVSSADLSPHTGNILATFQSAGGFPVSAGRVNDKCTVCLVAGDESTRTNIRTAERLGAIVRDANGNYSLPGVSFAQSEVDQQKAQQQALQQQPTIEELPNEAVLNAQLNGVDVGSVQAAFAQAGRAGIESLDIGALADATGKSSAEVHAIVSAVHASFVEQAKAAVAKAGIPAASWNHFRDWAWQNRPDEAQHAMLVHTHERSTREYRSLADAYLQANPPSSDAVRAAGYEVAMMNGREMVNLPGKGWISIVAARKGRLI